MQLRLAIFSVFFAGPAIAASIPQEYSQFWRRELADFHKPPKLTNVDPLEVDMNWEFAGKIKPVGVKKVREWPRGQWNYPSQCVEEVKDPMNTGTCKLANMKVLEVTYHDCPQPWTLCYCGGSPLSQKEFINYIALIPVKTRDYLRHAIALPSNGKTLAYLRYPDMTLTSSGMQPERNGQKRMHFFLIFHELGHLLDQGASQDKLYLQAIEKDTCILRDTPSLVENFGNLGPLVAARHIDNARYNEIYKKLGLSCLKNQLDFANSRMGKFLTWGGTCGKRRSPNFTTVHRPNGVLTRRDMESTLHNPATVCLNYQGTIF